MCFDCIYSHLILSHFSLPLFPSISPFFPHFSSHVPYTYIILCNYTKSRIHKWDESWCLLFGVWLISLSMTLSSCIQFSTNDMISLFMVDSISIVYIYITFPWSIHVFSLLISIEMELLTLMPWFFYVLTPSSHSKGISTSYVQLNFPASILHRQKLSTDLLIQDGYCLYYLVSRETVITFILVRLQSV